MTKRASHLFCAIALGACSAPGHLADIPTQATSIPAEFEHGLVFVLPVTTRGDTLRFFTDTGGSPISQINSSAVERLGLERETVSFGERSVDLVEFPIFQGGKAIPPIPVYESDPVSKLLGGRLAVAPDRRDSDGLLGKFWHSGRVWTFDYPRGRLYLHPSAEGLQFDPAHTIPLGFKTDDSGTRIQHFPSVEAVVDGESFLWLLDTGATLILTDEAHKIVGGAKTVAASFVAARTFDRWRERHPEWEVIEGADANTDGEPAIIVPQVEIAGHSVGPALFVRRADANYDEFMSQWMDRPIEGALGGSVFRHFVLTIDYPTAQAHFQKAD